jgi:hypothetical protein
MGNMYSISKLGNCIYICTYECFEVNTFEASKVAERLTPYFLLDLNDPLETREISTAAVAAPK